MRVRAAALAILLLLAGCSVGYTPSAESPDATEQIGVEDGYRYDATLAVTPADGYNQTELSAVVARTTARVERLREVEIDATPEVVLQSRAAYRAQNRSFTRDPGRAGNARWEAAFMIGEDTDAGRVVDSLFGGAVAGYYLPGSDRIVLISETGETVDTRTLAHELVHALQDARGWRMADRDTFDGRLAATGLTEGEATAVARAYANRCGDEWACLPRAGGGVGNASAIATYPGVYLTFRAPYVAGAAFVDRLRDRGGWQAVTAAYDRPPASTRELLVAGTYPTDVPSLTVADRSGESWERYARPDRLGRATVHALFWANGWSIGATTPSERTTRTRTRRGWSPTDSCRTGTARPTATCGGSDSRTRARPGSSSTATTGSCRTDSGPIRYARACTSSDLGRSRTPSG
ncbi:hypothetical protein BRD04_05765 [Halobacteriales archaeon QS_9_67_17]|nr:MAG: hypothetical protein BRD04_05765 [Halobacteriales archaeon QS_9_67_17]